ncbi:MAG: glycerate-2-kinase family protein, partial [Candidatus Gracilibacteria bacterium]
MIKNRKKLLKDLPDSRLLLDIAEEALKFLSPENLIKNSVKLKGEILQIEKAKFDLKKYKKIFVIGAGKATYFMAKEINHLLKNRIAEGFINVPEVITKNLGKIIVNKSGHPFPDENGLKGAQEILKIAKRASEHAKKTNQKILVICLISGGGSAMLPAPIAPLSLKDKIDITKRLLKSTATIHEINTVRKHLSQIKGGNLAAKIMPADLIALYISDVKNDDLDIIASGPTVLDKSTSKDALNILKKYKIKNQNAEKVLAQNET